MATPPKSKELICANLAAARKSAGMTQDEVIVKLQTLGFNYGRGRLSDFETGRLLPTSALVVALKLIYKCEYRDILGDLEAEFTELLGKNL